MDAAGTGEGRSGGIGGERGGENKINVLKELVMRGTGRYEKIYMFE